MSSAGSNTDKDRWSHPATILVATDLTDLDRLMPFAFEQAAETGAQLILLHVLASTATLEADAAGKPYCNPSGALDSAIQVLDPWCAVARLKHVTCKALVQEGNTASLIAATALHLQADRVLLGTRSRGRLSKLLIGSVAEQVLRSVQLPVMTLGPETHSTPQEEAESSSRQRVVLLATTLHEASRPSAALACRIAASQGARLVLLHVLPPIDEMKREGLPTGLDSAAMCELRTLADETGTHCCSCVEPIVVHGTPVIEILATAAEQHASLIVLGSTARSSFESFTRDRTIYRVLAHARCPVLTLRAPASALTEADTKRLTMRS